MKYLYLHGLGQKPDSWNRVIKETKVSESRVNLSLSGSAAGTNAKGAEYYPWKLERESQNRWR